MQAGVSADSDNVGKGPEAVTLHVLCPFGTPPNRFTFANIPRVTTIAQLRVQLARTILGSTVPTTSRLIFLGRALTVDSATLGDVLVPFNVRDLRPGPTHCIQVDPNRSRDPNTPSISCHTLLRRHDHACKHHRQRIPTPWENRIDFHRPVVGRIDVHQSLKNGTGDKA